MSCSRPTARPARLFDQLRTNHLLLAGGSMSDWLVRVLLLRLAKGQKLSAQRDQLEILADDRWRGDPALMSFLLNFSPQTKMFQAGGPEFIDELWRRWAAKHGWRRRAPLAPKPIDADRTIVLPSYSRRDGEIAAKTMRAELEAEGFKVWAFGQRRGPRRCAMAWDPAIAEPKSGGCTVFPPLLSRNTHNELKDAVFRREWEAGRSSCGTRGWRRASPSSSRWSSTTRRARRLSTTSPARMRARRTSRWRPRRACHRRDAARALRKASGGRGLNAPAA